jgi:hypothetical protein
VCIAVAYTDSSTRIADAHGYSYCDCDA